MKLIIDDFKTIDKAKTISITIREDSISNKYFFILKESNDGFEIPYYKFNFRDYHINMLNYTKNFDVKLLRELKLDSVQPKRTNLEMVEIDDSDIQKTYIYEVTDSIILKRMTFDIYGDMINKRIISKKWR